MQYPLVTVTIPSYNHSRYILSALNSVLQEDYPNKEIVIIDDGSTDNSAAIIQQWVDEHKDRIPVTYISRANKGLAFTINELIDLANGECIAWLASDDMFCDNGISKRMAVMQQTKKKLIVGDCKVINEEGVVTHMSWMKDVMKRDVSLYKTDEGIMEQVLVNPSFAGSVLLLKKDVYDNIGKYPQNFFAEEWFFYQRCAAFRYTAYLDDVVSLYRRHDTNTSGKADLAGKKHLVRSIVKSYRMSWWLFPGFRMKYIALKEWIKWNYVYLRTYILK